MKSRLALLVSIALACTAVFLPAPSATGAFPGTNGSIAYTAMLAQGSTLCSAHPDGGTPYRLTSPDQEARDAAWSPGGDELLFTTGSVSDPKIARMAALGLGTGVVPVTSGQEPAWSPDGSRIAFVRNGAIYTADADGSNEALLSSTGDNPAWSPDGGQVAFDDELRDNIYDNGGVYLVPATGGEPRRLSGGFEPSWAPDGSEIAVRSSFFAEAILAVNVSSGVHRTLVVDGDYHHSEPSWSPDGQHIAFGRFSFENPQRDAGIWIVDADGSDLRQLTLAPETNADPDWQRILNPITPTTGRAVPCTSFPYERRITFRLTEHLVARGRVTSLDPVVQCHARVHLSVERKTAQGWRLFNEKTDRDGRFEIELPDRPGEYRAHVRPDTGSGCAGDLSGLKSHSH